MQNLALQQFKPQVLQLEAERAELLSRYQPTSARIREIDAKLGAARQILQRENHREVQESTTDVNPTWASLDSDLAEARSDAASLKATQATQANRSGRSTISLRTWPATGWRLSACSWQVDSDKQAFMSYVRKGEEARAARRAQPQPDSERHRGRGSGHAAGAGFTQAGAQSAGRVVAGAGFRRSARPTGPRTSDPRICSVAAISHAHRAAHRGGYQRQVVDENVLRTLRPERPARLPSPASPAPLLPELAGIAKDMAALQWGLREPSGFTMLVGDIGTGKTTLVHALLANAPQRSAHRFRNQPHAEFRGNPARDRRPARLHARSASASWN